MAKIAEISTQTLSIMWGVSKVTIAEYAKGWMKPAKIRTGVFDAAMAHKLYLEHKILPKYAKPDDDSESMDEARRRKEIALANLKELQEAEARGNLIDKDQAVQWLVALVNESKLAFMALPRRLAPAIYGATEIRDIETTIRAEISGILHKLARPTRRKSGGTRSRSSKGRATAA